MQSKVKKLEEEVQKIVELKPHLRKGNKKEIGLEYIDNLNIDEIKQPFE